MVKRFTLLYLIFILCSSEVVKRKPVASAFLRVVAFRVCFVPSVCRCLQSDFFCFFDRMLERHSLLWKWSHTDDDDSSSGDQLNQSLEPDRGFSGINTDCFRLRV